MSGLRVGADIRDLDGALNWGMESGMFGLYSTLIDDRPRDLGMH